MMVFNLLFDNYLKSCNKAIATFDLYRELKSTGRHIKSGGFLRKEGK